MDTDIALFKIPQSIYRVFTTQLYIGEEILHTVFLHSQNDILRTTGSRIEGTICQHSSKDGMRINLMSDFLDFRTGYKLIMCCLIHQLLHIFRLIIINTERAKLYSWNQIHLIAYDPVFHSALKALYQHFSIIHEEINHLSVTKTAVFCDQMQWNIIVRHGDNGLHAILYDLINQMIVEFQACFIWLCFIPIWKNT